MAEIISLYQRFMDRQCQFLPLRTLFENHDVVLTGDTLGAFYLDKRYFQTEDVEEFGNDNNAFYLWNRRDAYETKVSYMELVYAAYASGVRDIVIDMASAMQQGIDEALQTYRATNAQYTPEILFKTLLMSDFAAPMDAVVQMAGSLGMKVHALNAGLTGVATLFRHARGIDSVPQHLGFEDKVRHYRKHGLEKDKQTLGQIVRRRLKDEEIETMRVYMELRLSDRRSTLENNVFDETPTQRKIMEALGEKPFLGFFQNARLFHSTGDLDGKLRETYGDENVARLSLDAEDGMAKQPQYQFQYARKSCAVAMTEAYARARHARKQAVDVVNAYAVKARQSNAHEPPRQIVTRIY